ncbi:MAG: phosphonate ABC transporter ATP-binding protein [Dermatophilaceae bacterium]|nr:ATP-binding cassette domain-containing protein [Intrasporangiaceae bacterium]
MLETEALTKRYPDGTVALDGVDLVVPSGAAVVLLGSNGSGKSTLLRCSVRLLEPTSGSVRIGDVDVVTADARELRRVRRGVGVVFQHINLVDHVSVLSNVLHGQLGRDGRPRQWFAVSASRDARARAMHCLERAGVADFAARRADQLSGGQRQRVALARMLMQEPTMVLADEPVAALDPRAGREVMDLLWEIVEEDGLTLVCALHQLELARAYGERIVGLRAGRKILDCSKDELTEADISALYDRDTTDGDSDSDPSSNGSRPGSAAEIGVEPGMGSVSRAVLGGGR